MSISKNGTCGRGSKASTDPYAQSYDQGVVSIILVEPQFLQRFSRIADGASGAGFWKGLLTAMIELGALLGALNQGWIADKYSRKYSIVIAVCVFTVGSVLQTSSVDYAMLVIARFIGGLGIGMLSMVAPLYISEISPPEIRGTLLVLEEFSIVTGIVVAFWVGKRASRRHRAVSLMFFADHIRHAVHCLRMGVAPTVPAPDYSWSYLGLWNILLAVQPTVAGFQRARSRGSAQPC